MLGIQAGADDRSPSPAIEFITIQLAPLADGTIWVSMKVTVFDEAKFELLDQDVVDERVPTLDRVWPLLQSNLRPAWRNSRHLARKRAN